MPTYVTLMKYTTDGIGSVKEGPERVKAARDGIEAMGGKLLSYHLTLGQYDGVAIAEFPNDEIGATFLLALGSQGKLKSETMRAFTEDEFAGLVSNLP